MHELHCLRIADYNRITAKLQKNSKGDCKMLLTHVKIRTVENTGTRMLGFVSLTIDDMIVIHDIKILNGQDDLFLAMPSRMKKTGVFSDIVHPIRKEVRNTLEDIVFSGYKYMVKNNLTVLDLYPKEGAAEALTSQTFTDFEISEYENTAE